MDRVYIVCENITSNYIPNPMDWNNTPLEPSMSAMSTNWNNIPLKPRFDPIMPYKEPMVYDSKPNNIVCICKDYDTAKFYVSGHSNRYILGPYKIV